jgi:prepilin-type N-terminal cleavage/methylation domain-containing protein
MNAWCPAFRLSAYRVSLDAKQEPKHRGGGDPSPQPATINTPPGSCKPHVPTRRSVFAALQPLFASGAATTSTNQHPKAFSLVELLVVIAVIAILAALMLPVLSRSKEEGRATACISNLHQIGIALQLYVDANNNTLPTMRDAPTDTNALATNSFPTVNVVLGTELGNTNVLRCPSDSQGLFQLTGSSYAWNNLLNGEKADHLVVLGMNFKPQAIPVFFDKQGFHAARGAAKAVNYLYADQHIKNLLTIEGALPP